MPKLDLLQSLLPGDPIKLLRGVVVLPNGATAFAVNVNGNVLPASSLDQTGVVAGDTVLVAIIPGSGQAEAMVLGRVGAIRPATGTVATVPVGSQTITVTGADGATYTAYAMSGYSPTVGDNVEMLFLGGSAYVSKTNPTPAPPPPVTVAAPPPAATMGTTNFPASDSATWWGPGGWGSWGNPADVYQGDYGSGPLTGAWFYAGAPTQLAGRTINGGRFILGPRIAAGSYNSPETVNIWTHSSGSRPSGNVALLNGPNAVTAQPWQGLTTYAITQAQAQDLVNGGGICIQGGPYSGFQGIQANAQSGLISIDWSR